MRLLLLVLPLLVWATASQAQSTSCTPVAQGSILSLLADNQVPGSITAHVMRNVICSLQASPVFTGSSTFGSASNNQIVIVPNNTGTPAQILAQGVDANSDLVISSNGTGVVRTDPTHVLRGYHFSVRPDLNGGTTWSGNTAEGISNLFVTGGFTGTTGTGDASFNYFAIPGDTVDCRTAAGNICSGLELAQNFGGAGMKGSRTGIGAVLNLTATSGNTTSVGGSYVAGQFTMQGNVNDNGTSGTGNGKGLIYGINPVASLTTSSATFFKQLTAMEADTYAVTGSSVEDKIGVQIVQTSADAVSGTHDDVAFSLNNQPSAVGWNNGIEFGRLGGNFPIKTTGTMIGGTGSAGSAFTVANGIDWHLGTASNYWQQLGSVYSVNGAGLANSAVGYAVGGTQVIGFGSNSGLAGLNSNITFDSSVHSNTQNKLYLNLNNSVSSNNIQENFDSYVYLTGAQTTEINAMHSYFQVNAGASSSQMEDHESSMWNYGTIGEWDGYLALPTNQSTGTITSAWGLKVQPYNNNTTTGSFGSWSGLDCEAKQGSGSAITNSWCVRNADATQLIGTAGKMHVGSIAGPTAFFQVDSSGNTSSTYNTFLNNSSGTHMFTVLDSGSVGVGAASSGAINATLFVSDMGGAETYATHMGFKQTTSPTVTNGSLDTTASDSVGTITLSAAAPVVTFNKAWATAPHCTFSMMGSATGITMSPPSTTALTFAGGSSGNAVTYHCFQ